jgi:hypothetical protein
MEERMLDGALLQQALERCGATLTAGLTEAELGEVERRFGFRFAPDHRLLLSLALPADGEGRWPNWRDEKDVNARMRAPIDGLLFDVEHNGLWLDDWGRRPATVGRALADARNRLRAAPVLAPLYVHRMLPTDPHAAGNPVLSVMQSDIIAYGANLLDWFDREFHHRGDERWVPPEISRRLPFWSSFLDGG